jgi:hypothetical protein
MPSVMAVITKKHWLIFFGVSFSGKGVCHEKRRCACWFRAVGTKECDQIVMCGRINLCELECITFDIIYYNLVFIPPEATSYFNANSMVMDSL